MSTFDGGLYRRNEKSNAQFIMNMRKENLDYVEWVKSVLENITGTRLVERKNYNSDGCKRAPQIRLESNRHPQLTSLHDRIYIDKKKVIDPHMLKLMDAEALAIIFMADGGTSLDTRFKNPHGKIELHTKGFSYADNAALSAAIYKNTGVRTNVRKHGKYFYLGVKTADLQLFVNTVKPYVCKSFLYKIERLAPVLQDDEIVCTAQECVEVTRDE